MIRLHKLNLVGIVEAKVRLENVDLIVKHCFPSQWSSFHNASTGSVARMFVAWNPQVLQVDLVFSSPQLIVVKVLPEDQKLSMFLMSMGKIT